MSWWTDELAREHNRQAIERDREASRSYRIVEVPRRAGLMEKLECELHRLAEAISAQAST